MKVSFNSIYKNVLSETARERCERIIIIISIVSFLLHLAVILLIDFGVIPANESSDLLKSPIAALYTPFSFILIYEVYLLVYYIPKSISTYIGKQYEIITLIVIRRLFKDLSNLELSENWFDLKYDLQFTYDIITTVVLFYLIYLYQRINKKSKTLIDAKQEEQSTNSKLEKFIYRKKILATLLVPLVFGMAFFALSKWTYQSILSVSEIVDSIRDVDNIFFNEFFTVLILTDVLLLLLSFFNTSQFSKVIRNSGFIISTILIRLSFNTEGILNNLLIVVALLFGVAILYAHNLYEKLELKENQNY